MSQLLLRMALLALIASVLVLALSPDPVLIMDNDKNGHVLAFVAMAALGALATGRRWWVAGSLGLLVLGIEIAQRWMALGREAEFSDVLAGFAGIAIGLIVEAVSRRAVEMLTAAD